MFGFSLRLAAVAGTAAAVTLIGGVAGAHAYAATSSSSAPPTQQQTSAQTMVLDPTKSFAMKATPTVKATPFWGEPKAG
jgi:hypothetical protein